jgi:hypothetical protein
VSILVSVSTKIHGIGLVSYRNQKSWYRPSLAWIKDIFRNSAHFPNHPISINCVKTYLPKIKIFRVKNRDRKPQFFDKHLSKTRKVQFRILMKAMHCGIVTTPPLGHTLCLPADYALSRFSTWRNFSLSCDFSGGTN